MGFWGDELFQSDRDLDTIGHLDWAIGLHDLEEAARTKLSKKSDGEETEGKDDKHDGLYYTVLGGGSHPELVKKHIESTDGFKKEMMRLLEVGKSTTHPFDWENRAYAGLLLGACAMTLGCDIPGFDFKAIMKQLLPLATETSKAQKKQLKKALAKKGGYVPGTPYNFYSAGLCETANLNDMLDAVAKTPHSGDKCGLCGSDEGHCEEAKQDEDPDSKTPLMMCGRCKKQMYCSKYCQKHHWNLHKKVCEKVEMEIEDEDEDESD